MCISLLFMESSVPPRPPSAYPENCQSCGQCYLNCKGRSLGMTNDMCGYPITAFRGVTTAAMNRKIITMPGVVENFTKGALQTDLTER